ncbi:MAG: hypothetical protein O2894_06575 [Planctomycetota bacterium]|nr:hypothetical protein [Planctomycetota bacterium]
MGADRAPTRRRDPHAERPRTKRRGLGIILLLFIAAPAAAAGWYYMQPPERQTEIVERLPEGWQDRGIKALIAIGALFVLAKIVLPLLHGAAGGLGRALAALRSRPTWLRVLLFPIELVVWILYAIARLGFAADAVLIVALCLGSLLLVARILKPEILADVLPQLVQ